MIESFFSIKNTHYTPDEVAAGFTPAANDAPFTGAATGFEGYCSLTPNHCDYG